MQDASQLPGGLLFSGGEPVTYDALASGVNSGALNYVSGPEPTAPTYNLSGGGTVDYAAQQAAAQKAADINLINQIYNTQKTGYQTQLGTLGSQQSNANARVMDQYNTRSTDLADNRSRGLRNLTSAQQNVDEQRIRSLGDIRDSLQRQSMSYNNQLGALGAGDSSAAGMINMALSGLASKNRGSVMDNASDQTRAITTKRDDLEVDYGKQVRDLGSWKNNSLTQIAQDYMSKRQAIESAMAQADAAQAQALAAEDASYRQQAIQALQNVENMYRTQADQINSFFTNYTVGNNIGLNANNLDYTVNPIQAGQLRNVGQVQQYGASPATVAAQKKYEEDQQSNILGY